MTMQQEDKIRARFSQYSAEDLVDAIESGEYTDLATSIAIHELESRDIELSEMERLIHDHWREKIATNLKAILRSKKLPQGSLLDESTMRNLVRQAYDEWVSRQKDFEIDTTLYWPAAFV